ncbi:MAG TPA: hypothetical protein PLN92_07390, partial [Thermotogota bacterium]|nr:hypothetical protein [Thermotogota bacterium]
TVTNDEGRELFNQEAQEYDLLEDDKREIIQNSVGMEAGEEKEFRKEYAADAEGNKTGKELKYVYHMKLVEVYKKVMPDLTDDFAKDLKEVEGDSLEEIKSNIRQEAKEALNSTLKNSIKNQIISALVEDSDIALSDETLKEFLDSSIESMKKDSSYESEIERVGSQEDLNEQIIDANVYQLKKMYVINKVFKESGQELTEDMFKDYVERLSPAWGMTTEQALGFLEKDKNVSSKIHETIMQEKVAEYLMDKCTIVEKPLPTRAEEKEAEEVADKIIEEVEKTAEKIEKEDKE